MLSRRVFYYVKPAIPRRVQLYLRRRLIHRSLPRLRDTWPIDPRASRQPQGWSGWPDGKRFAVVLTHDVDTAVGQDRCRELLALDRDNGFFSSFNFVPERYPHRPDILELVRENQFEVGVHGLHHDGQLYASKAVFEGRARKINEYLHKWAAVGFRSPAMHHNLDWLHTLKIEYDASTFDTDPFEPQPDGVLSIFPFWVAGPEARQGYVELPYTLPQDFTLFVLMGESGIDIWKRKLDWVVERGGMVLVNTHPDYMHFSTGRPGLEEYTNRRYVELLRYIRKEYKGTYWHGLPRDVARFWRSNMVGQLRPGV